MLIKTSFCWRGGRGRGVREAGWAVPVKVSDYFSVGLVWFVFLVWFGCVWFWFLVVVVLGFFLHEQEQFLKRKNKRQML